MKFLSVFLVTLVTTASALQYTADVRVDGDPNVYGEVTAHMWYLYNEVNISQSMMRIDYNPPVNMKEIFLYQNGIHYRNCGQCEAETYKLFADQLYKLPTDTATGGTYRRGSETCQEYQRQIAGNVKFIYLDTAGKICRVKLQGSSGTRTYTFSNVDTSISAASVISVVNEYKNWNCPGPVCNRVADMVLVLDESGSIVGSQWAQELDFADNLVSQFTVSTTAVNVGTVFFDHDARIISTMQHDHNSWENALRRFGQGRGNTCIGCGMALGHQVLNSPLPGRSGVSRMMFTLTDGYNNVHTVSLSTAAAQVKNAGILSFAIGVGYINDADLETIKSRGTGFETKFYVNSFSQLDTLLKGLVTVSCQDLNLLPCGSACHGFCSCGGACTCPVCPKIDSCTTNVCNPANPKDGCAPTPVNCVNASDKCFTYGCNPQSGCTSARVDCNDNKVCTTDSCVPRTGCQNIPIRCDDNNKCTTDTCENAGGVGCRHVNITCNDGNACTQDGCDPKTGCITVPVVCDDGDPCTDDTCLPASGCRHTPKSCDDRNQCTTDSCDPQLGCVRRQKDCDDHDMCTTDGCAPSTGLCTHDPVKCDACQQWFAEGHSCDEKPCMDVECVQVGDTGHECKYTHWNLTKCNSGNKCLIDKCNPLTEECSSEPKNCPHINCMDTHCDPATGACVYVNRTCSTADPCWLYECDNATDACRRKPKCPAQPCKTATCDSKGDCTYTDMNCDAGTPCLIPRCENDKCEYLARDCDDGEVCTRDYCHAVLGCQHEFIPCDDNNPCTNDTCVNGTGCVYKPKCDDNDFCTVDACDRTNGKCSYSMYPCKFVFSEEERECFEGACSTVALYGGKHCYKKVRDDAFLNPCGECIQTYSTNKSIWNTTDAGKNCVGKWELPKFIATLSGGIIAGIVIGVLAGVAILAVLGTLATKELIRRARLAQDQSAHNNPLYKDNDREMQNPAFGGK